MSVATSRQKRGLFGMNLSLGTSVEAGRAFEARDDA
jgi:hypothetical protein